VFGNYFVIYWVCSSWIFVVFEICIISHECFLMVYVFMDGCLGLCSDNEKSPDKYFFPPLMVLWPNAGHGLLILDEVSRSHTRTHHSQ